MILADRDGTIWYDAEPPSKQSEPAIRENATLYKYPEWPILFRFEENGTLTMFFVKDKPFRKLTLTKYHMELLQERHEVYTDIAHIYELCAGICQILGDGYTLSAPTELLLSG